MFDNFLADQCSILTNKSEPPATLSQKNGKFPSRWKKANVVPIQKKGDK